MLHLRHFSSLFQKPCSGSEVVVLAFGHFAGKKGQQQMKLQKLQKYSAKFHEFQHMSDKFRYLHEDLILKGSSEILFQVDSHFETIFMSKKFGFVFFRSLLQPRWRSCVTMEMFPSARCIMGNRPWRCPRNLSVRMKMAADCNVLTEEAFAEIPSDSLVVSLWI